MPNATLHANIIPNQTTNASTSIAFNRNTGTVCVAWKGFNNTQINLIFNTDQKAPTWPWQGQVIIPNQTTNLAPAVAYAGNRLFIAWVATDGTNRVVYTYTDDGGGSFPTTVVLTNATTYQAPWLIGGSGNSLLICFTGTNNQLNVMEVG